MQHSEDGRTRDHVAHAALTRDVAAGATHTRAAAAAGGLLRALLLPDAASGWRRMRCVSGTGRSRLQKVQRSGTA